MKIGTIILKDTQGNYINIHASGIPSESKEIFKKMKAEARLFRAKGEPEAVTIDGKEIKICGIWLFTDSTDKYISINGMLTQSEEKQKVIKEHAQKSEQEKINKETAERKRDEQKEKETLKQKEIESIKFKEQKLKELQVEKESLLLKAQKAPKSKPAKGLK